jgi:chemotaxis methyl-accepting protein methylase
MTGTPDGGALFLDAASILARHVGLRLDAGERGRLARCVNDEAAAHGLEVASYVKELEHDAVLLQGLLDRVTVQETAFFRDPLQFEALREHILPGRTGPITIWSAGCANGQEPYSLAMLLDAAGSQSWRVIASDVSRRALERTRLATYSARELAGVSETLRKRYFVEETAGFQVAAALRERVEIVHHNLITMAPPFERGEVDVVFCRNVLIYVGREEVIAFLERVEEYLAPDGWLFLGFSESLWQVSDRFRLVQVGGAFIYKRSERGATATEPTPPPRRPAPRRPVRSAAPRPPRTSPQRPALIVTPPAAGQAEDVRTLLAVGEAALEAGDYPSAIGALRKSVYLDADQPIAHLQLGFALEAAGDRTAARRAFAASRASFDRCDAADVDALLEGYHLEELLHLLDVRLAGSGEERR